jgi:tetratricopeptide (TPR) repeat protein
LFFAEINLGKNPMMRVECGMKKAIILSILVIFIVFGAWQGSKYFAEPLADVNPLPTVEEPATTTPETPAVTKEEPAEDPIKIKALAIARKPLVIKKALPEVTARMAKEKIAEAVQLIEQNYDYDAPWLELGGYRRLIGDYDGALAAWKFLTEIRPQAYVPYHNIGDLYVFILKDHIKGESYFLKSLEVGPGNIQGYLALALLYKDSQVLKKQSLIDDLLLEGLKNNPKNFVLLYALGEYYRDNGDKTSALKYFEEALGIHPESAEVAEEIRKLKK